MFDACCPNSNAQHGNDAVGQVVSCSISRHFSGSRVSFEVLGCSDVSKETQEAAMSKSKRDTYSNPPKEEKKDFKAVMTDLIQCFRGCQIVCTGRFEEAQLLSIGSWSQMATTEPR